MAMLNNQRVCIYIEDYIGISWVLIHPHYLRIVNDRMSQFGGPRINIHISFFHGYVASRLRLSRALARANGSAL